MTKLKSYRLLHNANFWLLFFAILTIFIVLLMPTFIRWYYYGSSITAITPYSIPQSYVSTSISPEIGKYIDDKIQSQGAIWVSFIAGVATLVAVTLAFIQINLYKEASASLRQELEISNRRNYFLKSSQLLITLNAMREFRITDLNKDTSQLILTMLKETRDLYNDFIGLYKNSEHRDSLELRHSLLMILQQLRCFVFRYSVLVNNPVSHTQLDRIGIHIEDYTSQLIDDKADLRCNIKEIIARVPVIIGNIIQIIEESTSNLHSNS